jgi:cytoskeletal protein CcmA (bactofilin family)
MKFFGTRPPGTPPVAGFSVVDDRLTIHGDIETEGTVRVDGRVQGAVHRAGTLIVGAGGEVVGDVEAREVVVAGTIHGNVFARGRIEIEAGAAVNGQVQAATMALHEGGAVNGLITIGLEAPTTTGPAGTRRLELAPSSPASSGVARG